MGDPLVPGVTPGRRPIADRLKWTRARRRGLFAMLEAERNGYTVRLSNHTCSPGIDGMTDRGDVTVHVSVIGWMLANRLAQPVAVPDSQRRAYRLTDTGRRLRPNASADGNRPY